jgi:aconitate hydratase
VLGYIASPGEVMDPAPLLGIKDPEEYVTDDRMIEPPLSDGAGAEIERGPNIKPMPINEPLPSRVSAVVAIKLPDNVTTDDIVPAGTTLSNLRSNVPALSEHLFGRVDKGFVGRMREAADSGLGGVIVAGENYGQGSSREHAALCPMYAGVKAVLVKSLARIHRDNLINYGVLPLTFEDKADYDRIAQGDAVELPDLPEGVRSGRVVVRLGGNGEGIAAVLDLSEREKAIILAGGKLTYVRDKNRAAEKS